MISAIINVDTRPENSQNKEMFNGVVDRDFLIDGVINKIKFLEGYEKEIIVFVDEHEPLTESELTRLKELSTTLVIRKHNKKFEDIEDFAAFNDFNYIQALAQARGTYIFHFDGDCAAFVPNGESVLALLRGLEDYDYISYPSQWSPNPVHDDSFDNKYWVSTRFFCCKRKTINIGELIKCQLDYDYWKTTYPVPRLCHWTEHLLSSIAHNTGGKVYYPPIDYERIILFVWENYHKGLLKELNNMAYEQVKEFVFSKGGIFYPNNLRV